MLFSNEYVIFFEYLWMITGIVLNLTREYRLTTEGGMNVIS